MEFTYSLTQEQMKNRAAVLSAVAFFRTAGGLLSAGGSVGGRKLRIRHLVFSFALFCSGRFFAFDGSAALADAFYGAGGCFPAGRGNGAVSVPRD